jgi:hypothetical protein
MGTKPALECSMGVTHTLICKLNKMYILMVIFYCNFVQDEEQDTLIRSFTDLKDVLNQIGDLHDLDPHHFLGMLVLHLAEYHMD